MPLDGLELLFPEKPSGRSSTYIRRMSAGSWAKLVLLPAAAIAMRYSVDNFKLCPYGDMRYIMDVDTGVDDAMALMGMMSYSWCVEAITVVAGNTNMENAYNNTMRVLKELGQTQVCAP